MKAWWYGELELAAAYQAVAMELTNRTYEADLDDASTDAEGASVMCERWMRDKAYRHAAGREIAAAHIEAVAADRAAGRVHVCTAPGCERT
jgi:hypothetical protein